MHRPDPPLEATNRPDEHQTLRSVRTGDLAGHELAAALARHAEQREVRLENFQRTMLLTGRQTLLQLVEMNYYLRFIAQQHGYADTLDEDLRKQLSEVQGVHGE